MKKFTADFETATWKEDETWVWAWATCEIGNDENFKYGTSISEFIEYCRLQKNPKVYFHNLKFDGEFIIYWCLTNGFSHVRNKNEVTEKSFTTLISNMGQFYSIEIYFKKTNKNVEKITFYDSLKTIPFSVDETAKAFDLSISKLEIDYKKERKLGHKLTQEEINYIKNDVTIMAQALKVLFDENLNKMTRASNSLKDFKEIIGKNKFEHYFPKLDLILDKDIRKSYKGGFTYLNPLYKEKEVQKGVVLDVNSLYPYVMYEKSLPFGEPYFFEGKYEEDKIYNLYIQMITCSFRLKKNKIPTIQIKRKGSFFNPTEYLESSNGEIVCLVLTSVDLKLFFEQYDTENLEFISRLEI